MSGAPTAAEPAAPTVWDHEVDVVVAGSGAGGMAAALTAHQQGLSVLIVEKTGHIGGTTARSGGAVWLPLNDQSAAAGHPDTFERVWAYLHHTVGAAASEDVRLAFLTAGPEALRFLTRHTQLRLAARVASPDYYPDQPGASLGGRALDTVPYDGRLLGRRFAELRAPLAEFTVLGGMMVNLTDVQHLLAPLRSLAAVRHTLALVLRYAVDRARGYPRGTRLLLGNALAARLFASTIDRGIPIWRNTSARALVQDAADGGTVTGIRVAQAGRDMAIRARKGVVLATGGFGWNAALRAQHYPAPAWPHSMSGGSSEGEGLTMATDAGAALGTGHTSAAFWAPVSVLKRADGSTQLYPHLVWDRAKPGLLAVDARGDRFVDEATSYHDFVRALVRATARTPGPALLVCDQDFIARWGLGLALPGGRAHGHLLDAGYLLRAQTLEDLARQAGVDPDGLVRTVARFNPHAATGVDPDFGKGGNAYDRNLGDASHRPNPCLGPVRRAPFYAVKVYPGDVGTALGIRVDGHARALDARGQPVRGLYMTGNDMHSIAGGEYPAPGIALGPALTFGWLAGMHMASAPADAPSAPANTPVTPSTATA